LAAMDFFTVPTATFRVLYCFFVIGHGRRKIGCVAKIKDGQGSASNGETWLEFKR
jgi:hypothetical protein